MHPYLAFTTFYSLAFLIGALVGSGLVIVLLFRKRCQVREIFHIHMDAAVAVGEIDQSSASYALMVFDGICPVPRSVLGGSPHRTVCSSCGTVTSPGVEPVRHCTCDACLTDDIIETQWRVRPSTSDNGPAPALRPKHLPPCPPRPSA